MPRPLERCCLQDGLKLDLNGLIRRGHLLRNAFTTAARIAWTSNCWGVVAEGVISASMEGDGAGWFSVRIGRGFDERIDLVNRQRHFGGKQWYFSCPNYGATCICPMAPPWGVQICQPGSVGQSRRLSVPIFGPRWPRAPCPGENQAKALRARWARPRGMGLPAETEMDALQHI